MNFSSDICECWQPRAEKREKKFAGCQVNGVDKLENLQLTWGLKKIFAGKRAVLGGPDCPGGVARRRRAGDPPEGENGIGWLGGAGPYHHVSRVPARMGDGCGGSP